MRLRALLLGGLGGLVVGGLIIGLVGWWWLSRDRTETEVTTSALASVQELNRMTVFAAVLTTAATTTDPGFVDWLDSRQTLIASGNVEYFIEFAGLSRRDLSWDKAARTLTINVADPTPTRPNVDMEHLIRYEDGKIVSAFRGNARKLEQRNVSAIYARFNKDARATGLMKLARSAARTAISNNFKLPLQAAGIDAKVVVRFPGDRR